MFMSIPCVYVCARCTCPYTCPCPWTWTCPCMPGVPCPCLCSCPCPCLGLCPFPWYVSVSVVMSMYMSVSVFLSEYMLEPPGPMEPTIYLKKGLRIKNLRGPKNISSRATPRPVPVQSSLFVSALDRPQNQSNMYLEPVGSKETNNLLSSPLKSKKILLLQKYPGAPKISWCSKKILVLQKNPSAPKISS
jgi:hypothetical protein